jgi:hypothetical protein
MKIEELIAELLRIGDLYGNINVCIRDMSSTQKVDSVVVFYNKEENNSNVLIQ